MSRSLPQGYERQLVGDTEVVAHSSVANELASAVRESGTLYDWAAEQPQPRALRGRAPVYVASLSTGETVAVRHAWHGGLLAPITGDRWFTSARADREIRRSIALRSAGIETSEVLGFASYRAAFNLVRIDVVSRFVDNSSDLGAVLAKLAPGIDLDRALNATRLLLKKLVVQRLVHPDLNVKNILIQKTVNGLVALVIDIDTMQYRPGADRHEVMKANIERLVRSILKWKRRSEADFDVKHVIGGINMDGELDPTLPPLEGFDR